MARSPEPPRRTPRRRGVLRHYHQPVWKDRLFWIVAVPSVVITALVVAVLVLVSGPPDTTIGWARPVLLGLIVLLLSFRLLGAGVTTSRKFQTGLSEGTTSRPGDLEAKGRAAGAVVGRAVKAAKGAPPSDAPSSRPVVPSDPDNARPAGGSTSSAARAAGRAVGTAKASMTPRPVDPTPTAATVATPIPTPEPPRVVPEPDPAPPIAAPDPDPGIPEPDPVAPEPDPAPGPAEAPPTPASAPATATTTAAPGTADTVDRAARVVGSMIGRRLRERRRPPS